MTTPLQIPFGTGGGTTLTPTTVKTSAYTAAPGEFVPVDSSTAAVTVTLPAAPADKTQVAVKVIAAGNPVTVSRGGTTDVFNRAGGETSRSLTVLGESMVMQYAASTGIWYVQATAPVSSLDVRYASIANVINVQSYGTKGDSRQLYDGNMAALSYQLTSLTANFTAADVGKRVFVYGNGPWNATITAVGSPTQVTLDARPAAAITNQKFVFGTDDAPAINAAITASKGGIVYLPPGAYLCNSSIVMKTGILLQGAGSHSDPAAEFIGPINPNGLNAATTLIGIGLGASAPLVDVPQSQRNFGFEQFACFLIHGPNAADSRTGGHRGFNLQQSCVTWRFREIDGSWGSNGIVVATGCEAGDFFDCHWREGRNHAIVLVGACARITTNGACQFHVTDSFGVATAATNPANMLLAKSGTAVPTDIKLDHRLWDETSLATDYACLYVDGCDILTVQDFRMWTPTNGYGIYLGPDSRKVAIRHARIEPYNRPVTVPPNRVPKANIFIDPAIPKGEVSLEDISTPVTELANGGISDTGGVAIYRNVNGLSSVKTKAGVPVPADFADMPGQIVTGLIHDTVGGGLYVRRTDGSVVNAGSGGAGGMANPMTTAGDLIAGGVGGGPTRLGVGPDGQYLRTVAGAPAWSDGPITKVLGADVGPIAASTTLQDVTGLGVAIGASATEMWLVKYWLLVDAANAAMDAKFGFTFPAAATGKWGTMSSAPTATASWVTTATTSTPAVLANLSNIVNVGTPIGINGVPLMAIVFGGGAAGTLQLQFAQNTSDAGNLKIDRGSVVEAIKLAA